MSDIEFTGFNRKHAHLPSDFVRYCKPGSPDIVNSPGLCGGPASGCTKDSRVPCCYGITNGDLDRNKSVPCYTYKYVSDRRHKHPSGQSDNECNSCVNNYTDQGAQCCDAAFRLSPDLTCDRLERDYHWDCSGCLCPGDNQQTQADRFLNCPELVASYGCNQALTNGTTTGESCPKSCAHAAPSAHGTGDDSDKYPNCPDLVNWYGCNAKLTDGTTTGESCHHSCPLGAPSNKPIPPQPWSLEFDGPDRLRNCSELIASYGCKQPLAGRQLGMRVYDSCPESCKKQKPPAKKPDDQPPAKKPDDQPPAKKSECNINPCPNPEQYLTDQSYPLNVTASLDVMVPMVKLEYQLPFLTWRDFDEPGLAIGVTDRYINLPSNPPKACAYQLILWWFNNEMHTCTEIIPKTPLPVHAQGKLGSKLAQLMALLAVAIIPWPCIDKKPPELAQTAFAARLGSPSYKESQEKFYSLFENEERAIVTIYDADSEAICKVNALNWSDQTRTTAYDALVSFLAIIRPPLEWCVGEDCSNPSNEALMTWITGACLPPQTTKKAMCKKLKEWKQQYNVLGSYWQLASNLLISESAPDPKGATMESQCVLTDARRQAAQNLYCNESKTDCCDGIRPVNKENFKSPNVLGSMLASIKNGPGLNAPTSSSRPTPPPWRRNSQNTASKKLSDAQVTPKKESKGFNWPLFGAVTGVVVVAIILIIGFVFLKRKSDRKGK